MARAEALPTSQAEERRQHEKGLSMALATHKCGPRSTLTASFVQWFVGARDGYTANCSFTIRARAYLEAVEGAFGADVDYALLVKLYGESPEAEKRYSPAECIGCRKTRIEGNPDPASRQVNVSDLR